MNTIEKQIKELISNYQESLETCDCQLQNSCDNMLSLKNTDLSIYCEAETAYVDGKEKEIIKRLKEGWIIVDETEFTVTFKKDSYQVLVDFTKYTKKATKRTNNQYVCCNDVEKAEFTFEVVETENSKLDNIKLYLKDKNKEKFTIYTTEENKIQIPTLKKDVTYEYQIVLKDLKGCKTEKTPIKEFTIICDEHKTPTITSFIIEGSTNCCN